MWFSTTEESDEAGGVLEMMILTLMSTRPDQHREHQETPQHLQPVIEDPTSPRAVDGSQVVRQALDLFGDHRADRKDAAHAERLAEVP